MHSLKRRELFLDLFVVKVFLGWHWYFVEAAYGDFPAFLFLWTALLVLIPVGNAVTALTFGYYVLQPFFPSCTPPEQAVLLCAMLAICEFLVGHRPLMNSGHWSH